MYVFYVGKMNDQNFQEIKKSYKDVKKDFQEKNNYLIIKRINEEIKEYSQSLLNVFSFLIEAFKGKLRKDNKTPLVFHSIYLVRLLYFCGEKNLDTLLIAALHDVLEDTNVTEKELISKSFLKNKQYLINYLKILKEDKSLSREPDGINLPPRYKEHIKRIMGAPKEVINVEIADRFSDLMDLDYILNLPESEKNLRLKSKIIKVRGFVENITKNRNDINKNCLNLFNYKVEQIERRYNLKVKIPVIS